MNRENNKRKERYKKDTAIEKELKSINNYFNKIDREADFTDEIVKNDDLLIVFIIGLQRSGTTLLMQLLSECFDFTYPNNIIARFWQAPYIGVIISKSLEKEFKTKENIFVSDYGNSKNIFGPHEFGYFWYNWFKFKNSHQLSQKQLNDIDINNLKRQLILMRYYGNSPLLFKAVLLSLHCDFLAEIFPQSLFIHMQRDMRFVAQSTYRARISRYGTDKIWWSLKPENYKALKRYKPVMQVVKQVFYSNKRIEECLDRIHGDRKVTINYKDLCESTNSIISRLRGFFNEKIKYNKKRIDIKFRNQNTLKVDKNIFSEMCHHIRDLKENNE